MSPAALVLLFLASATPAAGQLRPLDPMDWRLFDAQASVTAQAGAAVYAGQRASLAGTRGTLVELGNLSAAWRSGRIAVEAAGTVLRLLRDEEVVEAPYGGARDQPGDWRDDSGDYRLATSVRVTPDRLPFQAAVRFGSRLPTTANEVGLERDRTDFYAVLAGRLARPRFHLLAEAGIGIHGTHEVNHLEQSDVLVFVGGVEVPLDGVAASLLVVGHADALDGSAIRGSEELAELRLRLRTRGRHWVEAQAVRGLTEFSPAAGLQLSVGTTR